MESRAKRDNRSDFYLCKIIVLNMEKICKNYL